jgi:hypothetical protein
VNTPAPLVLAEPAWRARVAAHEARVRAWTDPHQARAARGEKHPVYDFLFTYYAFRPAWLRRWHPGPGLALAGPGAQEFLRWPEYRPQPEGRAGSPSRPEFQLPPAPAPSASDSTARPSSSAATALAAPPSSAAAADTTPPDTATAPDDSAAPVALAAATFPAHRRAFVEWLRGLLADMQTRPAFFGCYGLHEWAMVYRQTPEEIRHNAWPLRFPPAELARIIENSAVCCSHFDAFRFFTAPARPLNRLQPTRTDTAQLEQRGCLHANMDLYKWAFKLAPFTPAELIADCFELARDIREVDMRASPYDLEKLGFAPIPIETPAGRTDYERHQRAFAARGEPLRARLLAVCAWLLAA